MKTMILYFYPGPAAPHPVVGYIPSKRAQREHREKVAEQMAERILAEKL